MSEIASLINRSCTIVVSQATGEEDDFSNEKAPQSQVATVCEIQQRQRDEDDDQGELSDADWNAFFLPADEDSLSTASQLWVADEGTFEFVGAPWAVRDPETSTVSHVEATLRRTAGAADTEGS